MKSVRFSQLSNSYHNEYSTALKDEYRQILKDDYRTTLNDDLKNDCKDDCDIICIMINNFFSNCFNIYLTNCITSICCCLFKNKKYEYQCIYDNIDNRNNVMGNNVMGNNVGDNVDDNVGDNIDDDVDDEEKRDGYEFDYDYIEFKLNCRDIISKKDYDMDVTRYKGKPLITYDRFVKKYSTLHFPPNYY